jgi:hypothetical protein
MTKKTFIVVALVFFVLIGNNNVFSQSLTLDAALLNASDEIVASVPNGTKVAIINIVSDYVGLSDYVINELIANLVNARVLRIVPRSIVELEAAQREFDFQMSGYVSDESQKRLGKFLEADTIITGSVTRNSGNTFRLVINTIDLENFTYQSSYRTSIQNNGQMRTLITSGGGVFYEDYTVGQRIGTGFINSFFGLGSIIQGQHIGWVTTGTEVAGITLLVIGLSMAPNLEENRRQGMAYADEIYERDIRTKTMLTVTGSAAIGAGILFGFIIPFFHHKPNNTNISENIDFPINIGLVSTNNGINGIRILYNFKL